jgi:hypothetical protein
MQQGGSGSELFHARCQDKTQEQPAACEHSPGLVRRQLLHGSRLGHQCTHTHIHTYTHTHIHTYTHQQGRGRGREDGNRRQQPTDKERGDVFPPAASAPAANCQTEIAFALNPLKHNPKAQHQVHWRD